MKGVKKVSALLLRGAVLKINFSFIVYFVFPSFKVEQRKEKCINKYGNPLKYYLLNFLY